MFFLLGFVLSFFYTNPSQSQSFSPKVNIYQPAGRVFFGSADPEQMKRFTPSGEKPKIHKTGDWTIKIYPPVYYSNEENPDTSKDRPASVIVSYKGQSQFVGRGYMFEFIKSPKTKNKPLFLVRYWSGVMGCQLIDISFKFPEKKPIVEYRSTRSMTDTNKLGDLCEPSLADRVSF